MQKCNVSIKIISFFTDVIMIRKHPNTVRMKKTTLKRLLGILAQVGALGAAPVVKQLL